MGRPFPTASQETETLYWAVRFPGAPVFGSKELDVEIHQLRYFCAAAETGSFTRGARQEGVAQPTLSQQLIKLEKELGTKLFDRLQHRVRLTESGRRFLRSAKSILDKTNEARE